MSKPSSKPFWATTGDKTEPSGSKKATGWLKLEKPPYQFFNWLFNTIGEFIDYLSGNAQYNIIVGGDSDERDYATMAAYIADSPAAGDRVLIKGDEVLAATLVIPDDIEVTMFKGNKFTLATNFSPIIQFGDSVKIKGELRVENSDTGTIAKGFSFNGDSSNSDNLILENKSTGTVTDAFYVEAGQIKNYFTGEALNSGAGAITNSLTDNSGNARNAGIIFDGNIVIRTIGATVWYDIQSRGVVQRLGHSFVNFLSNASFEHWNNGLTSVPPGWVLQGATVARTSTATAGQYAAELTFNALDDQLYHVFGANAGVSYTYTVFYNKVSGSGPANLVAQEHGDDFTEYASVGLDDTSAGFHFVLLTFTKPDDGTDQVRFAIKQSDSTGTDTVWLIDECMAQEGKNLATAFAARAIEDSTEDQRVFGSLDFYGKTTYTPSTAQVINAAGDAILANATSIVLNPDADYVLTSTPTMADGFDGQVLFITCADGEANTVTLQDEATLGGSNLRLAAPTRNISARVILTLKFNGTSWVELAYTTPKGKVIQTAHFQTGAVATSTANMLYDDSIPQNTEGTQFMTLAITPKNANNILLIETVFNYHHGGDQPVVIALFQDSIANALAAAAHRSGNQVTTISFIYKMIAGTINPTTFKVRAGRGAGVDTLTFNGFAGARRLGGVMASNITITEFEPN